MDELIINTIIPFLGVGIMAFGFIYLVTFIWGKLKRAPNFNPLRDTRATGKAAISQWVQTLEPRLKRANIKVGVERIAIVLPILAIMGFLFGFFILKNLLAAFVMAISFFVLPEHFIIGRIQSRREKLATQLAPVANMFYTEMVISRNPTIALRNVTNNAPNPIRKALLKVYKKLEMNLDRPENIFRDLASDLDFEYGRLFAHVLMETWDNKDTFQILDEVAIKCNRYIKITRNSRKTLAWMKLMADGLILLMIPIFIIEIFFWPDGREFLVNTELGRIIVGVGFSSVLVNTIVQRRLQNVQY